MECPVTIADKLDRLATINAQIAANAAEAERLRVERDHLVREVIADGATLQRVADTLGVTRQRVHQWAQP